MTDERTATQDSRDIRASCVLQIHLAWFFVKFGGKLLISSHKIRLILNCYADFT